MYFTSLVVIVRGHITDTENKEQKINSTLQPGALTPPPLPLELYMIYYTLYIISRKISHFAVSLAFPSIGI